MDMNLWSGLTMLALAGGVVSPVFAGAIEAEFYLPETYSELSVTWSATPLSLPDGADVLAALVIEPSARPGPWIIALEPGVYLISAYSETTLFEATVTIAPDGQMRHEILPLAMAQPTPYRCPGTEICAFVDPPTGLAFSLPPGWAAEPPGYFDFGDGQTSDQISAVFYEDSGGEGELVWFLNPQEWHSDENGPCREIALGALCTYEETEEALAALHVIEDSLSLADPASP